MGIKFGVAVEAYRKKIFIYLSQNDGHHCSFAEIKLSHGKEMITNSYLLYPDGVIGMLFVNNFLQFKVYKKIPQMWVPSELQMKALTETLPQEYIMFSGEHQIREMSENDLLPKEEYVSDTQRFKNPRSVWDTVVAKCLAGE